MTMQARFDTHDIFNQSPPFAGVNQDDIYVQGGIRRAGQDEREYGTGEAAFHGDLQSSTSTHSIPADLPGGAADPLMSGASGRLWINQSGGRLELQSDAGDAQIVWSKTEVTVFDASSNTVYRATLPWPGCVTPRGA